jgi:L-ascorbate metabolism protein UlaG (beta-lactamase superfamily)
MVASRTVTVATLRIAAPRRPTALLDAFDCRVLIAPTCDPSGHDQLAYTTLIRTAPPAHTPEAVGNIDAVLWSHDQHADTLDHAGRAFVPRARRVLATRAGARCLGDRWQTVELGTPDGSRPRMPATPARHGPAGIEPLFW